MNTLNEYEDGPNSTLTIDGEDVQNLEEKQQKQQEKERKQQKDPIMTENKKRGGCSLDCTLCMYIDTYIHK